LIPLALVAIEMIDAVRELRERPDDPTTLVIVAAGVIDPTPGNLGKRAGVGLLQKLRNPDFVKHGRGLLPRVGPPNSVGAQFQESGYLNQLRIYGNSGEAIADIDWHKDHGLGRPHYHLWPDGTRDKGHSF
jgi:hypothetical protein